MQENNISPKIRSIRSPILEIVISIFIFILTLYTAPFFTLGDQEKYLFTYNELKNYNLFDGYKFYSISLGSLEIVHYFIVWVTSNIGLDKNLVMAFFNVVLANLTFKLFEKFGASKTISILIVVTNFYLMVLYFGAERLKFGVIFLELSILYANKSKIFIPLAFFSHVQTLIFYICIFFKNLILNVFSFRYDINFRLINFIPFFLFVAGIILLYPRIVNKIEFYSSSIDGVELEGLVRIFIFFIAAMYYARKKFEVLLIFIPIFVFVAIVGSGRVTLFAYFIFLYYAFQYKRGLNLAVFITTVFYAYKSFIFMADIFEYGNGFVTLVNN